MKLSELDHGGELEEVTNGGESTYPPIEVFELVEDAIVIVSVDERRDNDGSCGEETDDGTKVMVDVCSVGTVIAGTETLVEGLLVMKMVLNEGVLVPGTNVEEDLVGGVILVLPVSTVDIDEHEELHKVTDGVVEITGGDTVDGDRVSVIEDTMAEVDSSGTGTVMTVTDMDPDVIVSGGETDGRGGRVNVTTDELGATGFLGVSDSEDKVADAGGTIVIVVTDGLGHNVVSGGAVSVGVDGELEIAVVMVRPEVAEAEGVDPNVISVTSIVLGVGHKVISVRSVALGASSETSVSMLLESANGTGRRVVRVTTVDACPCPSGTVYVKVRSVYDIVGVVDGAAVLGVTVTSVVNTTMLAERP